MISRRNLLKSTAVATIGTVSTASYGFTPPPKKYDDVYDVVIVGAGGAGLAAACLAVQKKLKVVIIEKTGIIGGASLLCGGKWAVTDTIDQKERGIVDNDEKALDDMLKTGQYKNDPELVKAYLKETKEHYNFIRHERGIKPIEVAHGGGSTTPRAHNFPPAILIGDMYKYVTENGAQVIKNTKVERLVWDYDIEGIGGVKCTRKDGSTWYVKGKKGVLLAAGGFTYNKKLLQKFNPLMLQAIPKSGGGCTGDGILMAMAYGADTLDTEYIKATFSFAADPSSNLTCQAMWSGGIIVNREGKRIVDESLSYKLLGDAALAQENGTGYILFDEATRKRRMKAKLQEKSWMELYDQGKEVEGAFRGNTLEEVAKKAGINPDQLSKTVQNYNYNVKNHIKDPEFGRTHLISGSGELVEIGKGPYYIFPSIPWLIATYCGVRINTKAQVLNVFGEVIPHLYAAGEMTGGIHGAAYMTGSSQGKGMAFGRIAIKTMTS